MPAAVRPPLRNAASAKQRPAGLAQGKLDRGDLTPVAHPLATGIPG